MRVKIALSAVKRLERLFFIRKNNGTNNAVPLISLL